jgi:hypothetical protein
MNTQSHSVEINKGFDPGGHGGGAGGGGGAAQGDLPMNSLEN